MYPELLKKGLDLIIEINNLKTKAVAFVKEEGCNMPSLIVFMAATDMSKSLQDLMMVSA